MIRAMFRGLGKMALAAATLAFLTSVSLLLLGSFLATYPILRASPRERRLKATIEIASAGLALMSTFVKPPEDADENSTLVKTPNC